MNSRVKNLLFWVVVGLFMILLFNLFSVPTHAPEEDVIFSDFMAKIEKGDVEKAIIKGNHISSVLKDKTRIRTFSPDYPDLVKVLREKDVHRGQATGRESLVHYLPGNVGAFHSVSWTVVLLDAPDASRGE
jgi:ATP-dependent Zn protease